MIHAIKVKLNGVNDEIQDVMCKLLRIMLRAESAYEWKDDDGKKNVQKERYIK